MLETAGLLQSLIRMRPPGASLKKRQSTSLQKVGSTWVRRWAPDRIGTSTVKSKKQVTKLAEFALSQPQACYVAFTYGLKHRWTYFLRTLPDLENLLAPLEQAIADVLIPSITGHYCTQDERELLALPVRMGGMGLTNPSQKAASEYVASANISGPLAHQIKSQVHEPPDENEIHAVQRAMRHDQVKSSISGKTLRAVDLTTQKGASSWLTVLPIRDMNFDLNKSEFRDAVKLRYDWEVPDMPPVCVCGYHFNVDHAMICQGAVLSSIAIMN